MGDRKTRAQPLEEVRVPRPAIAQTLHLREQELRLIYDTVGDVIYVLALEGAGKYRFTSVNATFCTATGLNPDQVIGKRVDEIIPEPSLTIVLERYAEAIREKRVVRWEETSEYPTGSLTGEVSIAPAFDEAGNCTHLVGAVHDITERNQAAERVKASEERSRLALDAAQMGTWEWDIKTDRYTVSERHVRLLGTAPGSFDNTEEAFLQIVHPEDRSLVTQAMTTAIEQIKPYNISFRIVWPDGSIHWLEETAQVYTDEAGNAFRMIGITRDITERKKAEEMEQELRTIGEVARIVTSKLDIDQAYDHFAREIRNLIPFDRMSIVLADETEGTLHIEHSFGDPGPFGEGESYPLEGSITEYTLKHGKGIILDDTAADSRFWSAKTHAESGQLSWLQVPLMSKEKAFGGVVLLHRERNIYGPREMRLLESLATHISPAIENSLLFQEVKRTDEALKESEELYRAVIENMADAVSIGVGGKRVFVNEAFLNIYGIHDKSTVLGQSQDKFVLPEDKPGVKRRAGLSEGNQLTERADFRIRRPNGDIRTLQVMASPISYHGRPAALAVLRDVTEAKRMDEEIRKLNEELEQRVEQRTAELEAAMGDLVRTNTQLETETAERKRSEEEAKQSAAEARLLYSTAAAAAQTESFDEALQQCLDLVCDYVGWPVGHLYVPAPEGAGDLVSTSVWHLDDPDEFRVFREITERTRFAPGIGLPGRVFSSGEPAWIADVQKDDNFPRNKAARDIGVRGAFGFPVKVGAETVAVLEFFTRDVMETDAAILDEMRMVGSQVGRVLEREGARSALIEKAEELSRSNEELEAFSYSVSHDLRAPLRAIDGFSRILMEEHAPELSAEPKRFLHLVRENALQMGQLIDDLLNFSRLSRQSLAKQPVETTGLVHQVLEQFHDEIEERQVEISVGELPVCRADRALLRQVFVNLLGNAIKYTRNRDPAVIEVGCQFDGAGPGEHVYYVKDNGVGFDMKYADKLFGVFQRLHRQEEYEGTGVGLALVQRIVHRHGGRVWAEAEVDKGATFYVALKGDHTDG